MSDDPFEGDARRLTAAYTRWLQDHGHANPTAAASELIHMARGHGWRPVAALQTPTGQAGRSEPTEEWRAVKAEIVAKTGVDQP